MRIRGVLHPGRRRPGPGRPRGPGRGAADGRAPGAGDRPRAVADRRPQRPGRARSVAHPPGRRRRRGAPAGPAGGGGLPHPAAPGRSRRSSRARRPARRRCRPGAPPRGCSPATRRPRPGSPTASATCSARCAAPGALQLAGLPLGDPTARALAARLPTRWSWRNAAAARLVDELDARRRTRWSAAATPASSSGGCPPCSHARPTARPRLPAGRRAAARRHRPGRAGGGRRAAARRAPGCSRSSTAPTAGPGGAPATSAGWRTEMGAPLVSLTAPARGWPRGRRSAPGAARSTSGRSTGVARP